MIPYIKHWTPEEIAGKMKDSIIGQDEPIKTVATAISAHIARIVHNYHHPNETPIKKSNLWVLGPTGCGKTESVRSIIKKLELPIPIAIVPTNTLTSTGYKGKSIDTILEDLVRESFAILTANPRAFVENIQNNKVTAEQRDNAIVQIAQTGIIILDEIDKIRVKSINDCDNSYEKMKQYELLKIVEGTKGIGEDKISPRIDTTNILFIAMGAFTDLLKPKPTTTQSAIGFNRISCEETPETIEGVPTTEQLVKYGFIEELLGRFPIRCRYNDLSVNTLYRILKTSDVSPVHSFKKLFAETGNVLSFDDSALYLIAKNAKEINTGARALDGIISDICYPIFYDVDGKYNQYEITITKDAVNGDKPLIKPLPEKNVELVVKKLSDKKTWERQK